MKRNLEPIKIRMPIRFDVLVAFVCFSSWALAAQSAPTARGDQAISTESDAGPSSGSLHLSNASGVGSETASAEMGALGAAPDEASASWIEGPPTLLSVEDAGDARVGLTWENSNARPTAFLAAVWDIYAARWVNNEKLDDIWFAFKAGERAGEIELKAAGGYHVLLSNLYDNGSVRRSPERLSVQVRSGVSRPPRGIWLGNRDDLKVRLYWKPETFGTWHYQIIAQIIAQEVMSGAGADDGFVETQGPMGNSFFHFVDYGQAMFAPGMANFMEGWANFTMPSKGRYRFWIRGVPWLEPFTPGEYAVSPLFTIGDEKR